MVQIYEDSRGGRGNWSFKAAIAKGLAGAIGILAALIIDYYQKGTDSSLITATTWINDSGLLQLINMEAAPPYWYALAVLVAGFAMVYIFEPANKRNAFYAGAGVLGFLATFSPVSAPTIDYTPLDPALMEELGIEAPGDSAMLNAPIILAAYRPVPQRSSIINAQASGLPVTVIIQFADDPGNRIPQIRAWLHDNITNRTLTLGAGAKIAQTRNGPVIVYDTIVTTGSARGNTIADLIVRVEANGYKITTKGVSVTKSTSKPIRVSLTLQKSNTPISIQRLRYPYKW